VSWMAACATSNRGVAPVPERDASAFSVTTLEGQGSYTPVLEVAWEGDGASVTVLADEAEALESAFFEVHFDSSSYQPVGSEIGDFLGGEGQGFVLAQERLGPGRIHHCMRWIGICNRAFALMLSRAQTRDTAPGKPLAGKQIIQSWIAESAAEIQAARLMVLHAAWKMHNLGVKEAREEISLIKFFVANVMQKVVDRALQVHGGLGMSDDTILSFYFRFERAARIYDGVDEVHKISVAKRILREHQGKTAL